MPGRRTRGLDGCAVVSQASVQAQSVSLFGQSWQVQRFDYQQQVRWPNPVVPADTFGLLRVESAWCMGGNHFLVGTNHMNKSPRPTCTSFILEIRAQTDPQGSVTGFAYVRTLVENPPFDLRANGLAVNDSAFGIGAGGGLIVDDGFGDGSGTACPLCVAGSAIRLGAKASVAGHAQ